MFARKQWSASQVDNETLDADYVQGWKYVTRNDWAAALSCFDSVLQRNDPFHPYHTLYSSAHGLASVMNGKPCGLNQCRQAVIDEPKRADLYANLARAHLQLRQRKKAVDAIFKGLRVQPNHADLLSLKSEMGCRRRPMFPFLSRDNPLNRFIGRRTYRR